MIRILHVDDRNDDLELTKQQLLRISADMQIEWAESGEQALSVLEEKKYDCILCDYQMPKMDGLQVLYTIREKGISIPFIFLTGQGSEEIAAEALRAGADDYFTKEVGLAYYNRLFNSIERVVGARAQSDKRKQAEEALQKHAHILGERVKGLNCLYRVSEFRASREKSMSNVFQETVNLIPRSWQYPETTCARIMFNGTEYTSENFRETSWKQSATINISGESTGTVEVFRLKKMAEIHEGQFLLEERHLIDALAAQLGSIAEEKLAQEALRESEARYRTLFESTADGILIADVEAKCYRHANPAICKLLGYSDKELKLMNVGDIHPRDSLQHVISEFEAQAAENKTLARNIPCLRKDGTIIYADINTTKSLIDDRECNVGFFRDTTQRRQAEEALRESEERFRSIFENVPVGLYRSTPDGRILSANPTMLRMLGYSSLDEFVQMNLEDENVTGSSYSRKKFKNILERDGEIIDLESHWRKTDGSLIIIRENTKAIRRPNGKILYYEGMLEDITKRKRAEDSLRAAHEENQRMIDAISSILIGVNKNDSITEWNKAAEVTFGISAEQAVGQLFCKPGIHWEDPEIYELITKSMKKELPTQFDEIRFRRPNGNIGFLGVTINPLKGKDNEHEGFLFLATDLTERKILEGQLAQSQKLEAIGQLAAGIAHEINTPTQYVGDNTRFLQDAFVDLGNLHAKYETLLQAVKSKAATDDIVREVEAAAEEAELEYLSSEIPKAIEQSLEGVERVSRIVRAMKDFSHPGVEEKVATDLNRAIESTIFVARNEWKYVAEMVMDFDTNLPLVPCLPNEFNQVVLNIILNAAQAIANVVGDGSNDKGTIKVSTRHGGEWGEIRISDTGSGIAEETKPRVFDPFFTTKEVGKGTGQGLAISHDVIVKKHGGTITCETEVGKGTTFIIRLPIEPANA